MQTSLAFIIGLLQSALSLLGFVQQHPELPQATRDQAQVVVQQAVGQATQMLSANPQGVSSGKSDDGAISVSGMTKYTDSDFGFSFWYPSGWSVSSQSIDVTMFGGGTVSKQLVITGGKGKITLYEHASPARSIELSGGSCVNCPPETYYFDASQHVWMLKYPQGNLGGNPMATQAQIDATKIPKPADISSNTMGGLHIFSTATGRLTGAHIIPLSAHNFVYVSSDTEDYGAYAYSLVNTILATDPSVATPVSVAEQIKVIQAEKDAYVGK